MNVNIEEELTPIHADYQASNITEAEYQAQLKAVFDKYNTITE